MTYSYARLIEGLNGKTATEACVIEVGGENKWLTLIQNASRNARSGVCKGGVEKRLSHIEL